MFCSRRCVRAKLHLTRTISFAVAFLVLVSGISIISNLSLHKVAFPGIPKTSQELLSAHDNRRVLSTKEEVSAEYTKSISRPLLELKPEGSGEKFDRRVLEFFGGADSCDGRFFMTWITPAKMLGRREFLALESLFKAHPRGCLVILSTTMDSAGGYKILKPLVDMGFRVLSVKPDYSFLLKNTPAFSWFKEIESGKKDPGSIPFAQNLSNLIRLAVLYKYGGVYLDTDFIVLKNLSGLRNSIGAQSMDAFGNWTRLNNAVLVFDKNHSLLHKFMEEFVSTFDGNKWGHNGPYMVSRVVKRMASELGANLTVLRLSAFYPVNWIQIGEFFAGPVDPSKVKWVEEKLVELGKESYGVHLWNKQSRGLRIEEGSIIGRLISDNCVICKDIYSS
ncbi:hypothetical protein NMG60_11005302 [Bertholletia excelsa]